MESLKTIQINKQIFESINNYKHSFSKSENKNVIKEYLKIFNTDWFSNSFPDTFSFFDNIEINHPDLLSFIETVFYDDFIEKSISINKIINFCNVKKINNIQIDKKLPSILLDSINTKTLSGLANPEITLNHIRFLPKQKRWIARSYKNNQTVTPKERFLNNLTKDENVEYFGHNSFKMESFCEDLILKYNDLKKINCNKMAMELSIYIDKIKESLNQKKYGFYRIPISKIINIVSCQKNFDTVEIIPIKDLNYLKNKKCPDFIKVCENFFGKNHGIFDHYAEIKFSGISVSYLVGEIDSKSYFIGAIL
jgi:hypothetical protein